MGDFTFKPISNIKVGDKVRVAKKGSYIYGSNSTMRQDMIDNDYVGRIKGMYGSPVDMIKVVFGLEGIGWSYMPSEVTPA